MTSTQDRYKLMFFTLPTDLDKVKSAIFATGAGTIGACTECYFTTPGIGQFKPSTTAQPTVGKPGQVEQVGETKCEILCHGTEQVKQAVAALKSSHPYEEPAFEVYKLETL